MSLASWITLIAAVIAASAAITVGFLQRKSAEDALRETRKAVAAADESAKASAKAADAAERGAGAADRAATQIDEWRKREETMRMLRSGAEMAAKAKTDPVASLIGQAMLTSLRNSTNLVQPVDKAFIEQVIGAINQVAVDNLGDDDVPVIV